MAEHWVTSVSLVPVPLASVALSSNREASEEASFLAYYPRVCRSKPLRGLRQELLGYLLHCLALEAQTQSPASFSSSAACASRGRSGKICSHGRFGTDPSERSSSACSYLQHAQPTLWKVDRPVPVLQPGRTTSLRVCQFRLPHWNSHLTLNEEAPIGQGASGTCLHKVQLMPTLGRLLWPLWKWQPPRLSVGRGWIFRPAPTDTAPPCCPLG